MNHDDDTDASRERKPSPGLVKLNRHRFNQMNRLLLGVLTGAVAAYAAWTVQQPVFQTTAVIRILAQEPMLLPERADRAPLDPLAFDIFRKTQSQLMKSSIVMKKALARPSAADHMPNEPDRVKSLQRQLNVTTSSDSELMQVSLSGFDPQDVALLLNAVVQSYFDEIVNAERRTRIARLDELQRILEEKEEERRLKLSTIIQMKKVVGLKDDAVEVVDKRKEIEQLETISGRLAAEIHNVKIELSVPPRVQLIQEAEPGAETNWNMRVALTTAAGLIPVLMAAGLASCIKSPGASHRMEGDTSEAR